jgi:hypothetical protein
VIWAKGEPRLNPSRPAPPPSLVRLPGDHLRAYGTAADGRLFRDARGGILSDSSYGRGWYAARAGNSSTVLHARHLRPSRPRPGKVATTLIDRVLHPPQDLRTILPPASTAGASGRLLRVPQQAEFGSQGKALTVVQRLTSDAGRRHSPCSLLILVCC